MSTPDAFVVVGFSGFLRGEGREGRGGEGVAEKSQNVHMQTPKTLPDEVQRNNSTRDSQKHQFKRETLPYLCYDHLDHERVHRLDCRWLVAHPRRTIQSAVRPWKCSVLPLTRSVF